MSDRVVLALGSLKILRLLSALSILVVAFLAPKYVSIPIAIFGGILAAMTGIVLLEGVIHGRFLSRAGPIVRAESPLRFWGSASACLLLATLGLALTQLWRLNH
jgi:hypothetical protein